MLERILEKILTKYFGNIFLNLDRNQMHFGI